MRNNNHNYNYLWTGESVFCKCGHHVEYHKTDVRIKSVFGKGELYTHCLFKRKDEEGQDQYCRCKEFTPYKKIDPAAVDEYMIEGW